MSRYAAKHVRLHPDSCWLSSADLDSFWHPEWVGAHSSHSERKVLRDSRVARSDQFSVFVNNVASFWLSHLAVGFGHVPLILEHILVLSQIAEEKSNAHARKYELLLHEHLRAKAKGGASINLEAWLSARVPSVWNEVCFDLVHRGRGPPTTPLPVRDPLALAASKALPKRPTRPPPRQVTSTTDAPPSSDPGAPRGPGGRGRLAPICLAHDPANKRRCPNQNCSRTHVDTTKPDQRSRYEAAYRAAKNVGKVPPRR